jgi:hypothetical protein
MAERACILLWMSGGPSQTDTFDPKPGHVNGGPTKTISTSVPGLHIAEHLPGIAKHAKDIAVIRSMTSSEGDHGRATELLMTGYRPRGGTIEYPVLGSLVAKEFGRPSTPLPNYVSVSPFRAARLGAGFLGPRYAPLTVSGRSDDPSARANLSIENLRPPEGVGKESMERRFRLLGGLRSEFQAKESDAGAVAAHSANYEKAIEMVRTEARAVFKIDQEAPALREAYGRNQFGQGCLLARRLVERGVPFVEVDLAQSPTNPVGWDTHADDFAMVRDLCGVLDPAWSTLMTDLKDRGLLERTLVLWMGEFGRTPVINGNGGRDHYPAAWSTALAGGGVQGGQAYGDTGPDGVKVVQDPVTVPEFYASIWAALGVDPEKENISNEGRPIGIVDDHAAPIKNLISV